MWDDWELLMRQVAKTSQQFKKVIEEFRGPDPMIRVHDQDRQVKVVITTVPEQNVRRWAIRAIDDRLFVRGLYTVEWSVRNEEGGFLQDHRSDEFVKTVQLPAPIEAKPSSVRKDGNRITVLFTKKKESVSNGWYELHP